MTDTFSDCHPAVNVTFYMSAFMMGMCFVHPLFLICSFCLSMTYAALVKRHWIRDLTGMIGLFLILTILNPLFNTGGEKILFTLWNGRPYTWEALCYGAALSARFVTVLMWFATWNQVMTDDKLQYCIGRLAPSVALILTMVFRLVPEFQRKCGQISGARRCIGQVGGYRFREREGGAWTYYCVGTDFLGTGGRRGHGGQHEKPRVWHRETDGL